MLSVLFLSQYPILKASVLGFCENIARGSFASYLVNFLEVIKGTGRDRVTFFIHTRVLHGKGLRGEDRPHVLAGMRTSVNRCCVQTQRQILRRMSLPRNAELRGSLGSCSSQTLS